MADQEQGNIRQEFNLGRAGLNMDSSVNQIEKGQLTYALNASVENFDSNSVNYQNEPGNELCLNFPEGYQLIGKYFIPEQNKHIFFLTNPYEGQSEIGYMDNNDCVYHTFINSTCLNFNINYPIHKAVHKITDCDTEVYWTDGLNPRRFINLNNPPYTTEYGETVCDVTTLTTIDCNKIKVQPDFSIPTLDASDIVTGGDLKAGTYQFAIQYTNSVGIGYTSYYSITNPLPIANPDITTLNFDYVVGKSIRVDIGNLDLTGYFEYYNLAVIKTINSITSVELIGTYFIDGQSTSVTYTGQSKTDIRLSINDVFEKFPYYDIADDLAAVQDVLVWKGLKTNDRTSFQKIANQIDLQWQSYRIPATKNYSDELVASKYRGYLRDEVYAFEVVFLLKNGRQTDGFHIPGRAPLINDLTTIIKTQNNDFIGDGSSAPYWKIYNTATVVAQSPGYSAAADYEGPYEYGEMSYWESLEEYPCNTDVWGSLAGQPIRHHKFPDVLVSPIFESPAADYINPVTAPRAVFPIGVLLDTNQVKQLIINSPDLTQEQKDEIEGFKIVRGNRSTNKSIIGKGIIRNIGKYNREGTDYYFPNYPYNDLNEDPFLLEDNNAFNSESNTFKVVTTSAGNIEYTDVYTGEIVTDAITAGTITLCSLSTPSLVPAAIGTITNVTSKSYTITVSTGVSSNVNYTDPSSGAVVAITVYAGSPQTINSSTVPVRTGGSTAIKIVANNNYQNTQCYPNNLNAFTTNESKYRMVFNSPETSFGQPFLGNVLKLENALYGGGKAHFVKVEKHANYKLLTLEAQKQALDSSFRIATYGGLPFDATAMFTAYQAYLQIYINGVTRKNYAYTFNSVAGYDYSAPVENATAISSGFVGIKQRPLDISQYLIPGFQSVGDTYNVNNYNRETSVYLKTIDGIDPLPFASQTASLLNGIGESEISDDSRFTAGSRGVCGRVEDQQDIKVVSYYASLKNIIDGQWGQMYSYDTIDTGFQKFINDGSALNVETIFGGDTFISRFAFKTKLPFFIDNRVGAPDDSDVFYDELGNVAYPQYWYSARSILNSYKLTNGTTLDNIISYKAHYLDCPNDSIATSDFTTTTTTTTSPVGIISTVGSVSQSAIYDGKMYLFAYGIPYFYVESSINLDLRQAFNNQEGDFYPHVSSGIPDKWLQETVVPIAQDNTYYYNPTFSKQNTENFFSHLPVDWEPSACYTEYPFRGIYSDTQDSDPNAKTNNWLVYRPLSKFDFPQNYGELVSLDGIQNRGILARFENKALLYNNLLTINTSNPQAAYVGNPNMFSAPPIDFAETDLGYVGSQNKMLLKIPQGQITIDAKRGQVFLIAGTQAQDLSAFGSGMNRFFTDHLAFEILRYFPDVNTDNHFNGVGLHGVYDSKFDRMIISKLDYIPVNSNVKYDAITETFYIERTIGVVPYQSTYREVVALTDINYFCNKSWTLSFNFNTKNWVSFHSYIPNFYIAENNFFYSGLNEGCDLEALALIEVDSTTTTTTSNSTSTTSTTSTSTSTTSTSTSTTSTTTTEPLTTTTTTTTEAPGVFITVSQPGVFPYPVTAGNGSASGTLENTTASPVYVYVVFNSGGVNSGSIGSDGGNIDAVSLPMSGTITSFGQTIYSASYYTLASGASLIPWSLSKADGLSSGASLRLGYSTTPGGSITLL